MNKFTGGGDLLGGPPTKGSSVVVDIVMRVLTGALVVVLISVGSLVD